jgi:hypothetical protein
VRLEFPSLLAALALLAACAGPTFTPEQAPEFVVLRQNAPFYRYGPQQAEPPEARLDKGERVKRLRAELGYSLVSLSSGPAGYVANEDLAPAPPLPAPAAVPVEKISPEPEAVSAPPVEAPLPKPDLESTPADAPAQ